MLVNCLELSFKNSKSKPKILKKGPAGAEINLVWAKT
jgi:hypothetical protein